MNTTLTLDDRRPALRNAGAYAAAAWGVLFSLVHVYWLAGGRAGLPNGQSIFDNAPLLVIDVIAIPVSAVAAALALALVRPWGERFARRMLLTAAWGATAVMIVHALPSVVDWAALAVGAKSSGDLTAEERFATFLYEPWFMAGGLLFALAALTFQRSRRR
ncbi:DUF3995 domain-containing protein [Actinomadura barringtoniae]|uniref:DUF3995 domain-containing protein n=1 Tax=Actinomadura barringtoniae TaxID=1427535 RepID=A0A939PRU6_9ACTN|nr:DUF3995 domain-containing protein [Actinomadura barringtoniae]MBO2453601.1 DUF3995 domain-containing protein [Actinomadura barringtoniae]